MDIFTCICEMRSVVYILLFTIVLYSEARSFRRDRSLKFKCIGTSKIDIQSGYGVKIEPMEQSKVYIDSLSEPFDDGHSLRFEFKTTSGNATLFYAVRRNDLYDMVSGGIHDGYLQFKIRCKSSYADLTIPFRVDDGEWHKIKFQRKHRKGLFMLDDIEFFEQYYVGCGGFTSINFGNTNPEHDSSMSVSELKTSKIDIQSGYGVKIEPIEQSKVYIDSLSEPFDDGHSLRFEFKTTSGNATLFYAVRRNDFYDMVSGGIHDGYLQFKIRCKSSYADLTIPFRVNDGEWHKIKFQRKHRKGLFMLDDIEFFEQYYVGCGGFTSINFGNTNPVHDSSMSVSELKSKDGQMEGCIRKVQISTGIDAPPQYTTVSDCN